MTTPWTRRITTLASFSFAVLAQTAIAAEPIKLGIVAEVSGPNAEAGSYTVNGAKLAVDEINKAGGVLGRPLELKIEDNQSTNPGSVLATSKLLGGGDIIALLGPIRSTQLQAVAPTINKAGIPTMIGGSDFGLTHANNKWYFRVRPHDGYSAKVIADFAVNTLQRKKWAIVFSTDSFGTGGKDRLVESLKEAGITPVLTQGFTSNTQDFTPIVLAVKQSGADVIATYVTSSNDVGILAKQLRQMGLTIPWIGSSSISTATAMKLGGDSLYGTYSVADFVPAASPEAQAFTKKYQEAFKLEPDFFSSWSYDGVYLLANAIKAANDTKPEAIRKALLGVKGYKGVEGTYVFDDKGDGLHGYNVVKNDGGKVVFVKAIAFQPK
jgi:branched-chain amino acid transport system substrate-binding protein